MTVISVVKHFEWSEDWKSATEVQVHLPFHLHEHIVLKQTLYCLLWCFQTYQFVKGYAATASPAMVRPYGGPMVANVSKL